MKTLHVVVLVGCLLGLSACEPKPTTVSKNDATKPVQGQSPNPKTDLKDAFAAHPINEAVKTIPPKPFKNHWDSLSPNKSKKVGLHAFLRRIPRRVNLDKLKRSVPYLMGGITWRHRNGQNMFDRLKLTLGGADYISLGKNNDDVTKLFMKLMDDMAMNVCKNAIPADMKKDENKRAFVRFDKDVNKTLRFIRLKFHAVYVPPTSTDGIAKLRKLYDNVFNKTKNAATAWQLVCIATLTSPEFYVY